MAYLAGLIITGLFFIALKYFLELSKKQEIIIAIVILSVILSAIAFNSYSSSQREAMLDVVTKYRQGKTVTCNGIKVNDTNYSLSIGTYTFIGKENTPNYTQMISTSSCN